MSPTLPQFTAAYWQVEHALAATFGVGEKNLAAFRSRFGELQRGGLFGAKNQPGKGKRLVYTPDQFNRLLFAFSLGQFGLTPNVILRLARDYWTSRLEPIFKEAARGMRHDDQAGDVVLVFSIRLVSEGVATAVPFIASLPLSKLPNRIEIGLQDDQARLLINVTERLRRFHRHLVEVHPPNKPVAAGHRSK
jgi:hypothetical protein